MRLFVVIVAIILSAGVVLAQDPPPCDAPNAFECRIMQLDTTQKDTNSMRGHYAYDDENRRTSLLADVDQSKEPFHVIELFDAKKRYSISLKTKKCKVEALTRDWHHFGVPPNAKFAGQREIGTDAFVEGGVLVNEWHDSHNNNNWFGVFTAHGCIPVSDFFQPNTTSGYVHTQFYDVALGISDPSIFLPPSQCGN